MLRAHNIPNENPYRKRGWVQLHQAEDGWWVHDWSEHHDSGAIIVTLKDFRAALQAAQDYAALANRKMFELVRE